MYLGPNGIWAVSSYDGVQFIMGHPGAVLEPAQPGRHHRFPAEARPRGTRRGRVARPADGGSDAAALGLRRVAHRPGHRRRGRTDPHPATEDRQPRLHPRRVAGLQTRIDEIVAECLAGIENRTEFDLLHELAIPVPVGVIGDLLFRRTLTTRRRAALDQEVLATLPTSENRSDPESVFALLAMLQEFAEYFVPIVESRQANPQDDLISDLVRAIEDDWMTVTETVLFLLVMMSAGNETTTNLVCSTVIQLLNNPDQLDLLLATPDLLPQAIEESVRHQSPFQFLFREAVTDVEVCQGALVRRTR